MFVVKSAMLAYTPMITPAPAPSVPGLIDEGSGSENFGESVSTPASMLSFSTPLSTAFAPTSVTGRNSNWPPLLYVCGDLVNDMARSQNLVGKMNKLTR
jgi:hypothetical protein